MHMHMHVHVHVHMHHPSPTSRPFWPLTAQPSILHVPPLPPQSLTALRSLELTPPPSKGGDFNSFHHSFYLATHIVYVQSAYNAIKVHAPHTRVATTASAYSADSRTYRGQPARCLRRTLTPPLYVTRYTP